MSMTRMTGRKIFTTINKNKLRKLYTSLLKNAIEKKETEYLQDGYEFEIKKDVLRVCGKITPRACKYYLQGLVLNIPFEDWKIRDVVLRCVDIENETYIDFIYKDVHEIVDQYWDGMAIELSVLLQKKRIYKGGKNG